MTFPEGKEREKMEHNFGYSGQNIEEYSAILENKLDSITTHKEENKT